MIGGLKIQLLLGAQVPLPASAGVIDALQGAEITHDDEGRSGFELVFRAGRSGLPDLLDQPLLQSSALKPFNRVIVVAFFGALPQVLMDGIITMQQLQPGGAPAATTLSVTGEDVSVMMDMEEKQVAHPGLSDPLIAMRIIAGYARYGLVPLVVPPATAGVPLITKLIPMQRGTDLQYLHHMAQRYDYVFYVTPGKLPGINEAYFGPHIRRSLPQRALSVDLGTETNVTQVRFRYAALAAEKVKGAVQDSLLGATLPVRTFGPSNLPLSRGVGAGQVRTVLPEIEGGLTVQQAMGRAQGRTDRSLERTVVAEGEVEASRYGAALRARQLVDLRGAGESYDGTYYVKRVTHVIQKGQYRQRFTLTRQGIGALLPMVRP